MSCNLKLGERNVIFFSIIEINNIEKIKKVKIKNKFYIVKSYSISYSISDIKIIGIELDTKDIFPEDGGNLKVEMIYDS